MRGWRHGVFVLAIAQVPAVAADWSVQSTAQLFAQAESNPRLLPDRKQSAQAGAADLALDLGRSTELLDLDLNAHASVHRYSKDVSLDRDDQQLDLTLSRRGERYALRGDVSFTRDTTLTSELGTTGITEYNQRHRARGLSFEPTWQLSERVTAGLVAGWQDSLYARAAQSGLVNYNYRYAGLNSEYALGEQSSLSLAVSTGRLDTDLYDSTNVDASLQLQHVWSPRWTGALSAGPSWVRTASGAHQQGSVFAASLSRRQAERLNFDASLSRSIAPTGSGFLSRRDTAGLRATAALAEHLTAVVNLSLIHSRDYVPLFGFTINDVRYAREEASLSWQFARDWSLGFAAGHSRQELLGSDLSGHNLDARLQLVWRRYDPVG